MEKKATLNKYLKKMPIFSPGPQQISLVYIRRWASHKLSIFPNAKPISQKKRKLGENRRQATIAEADILQKVRFVSEDHYTTWLANVVLV